MSNLEKNYEAQVNIFLQNDKHSSDVITLFQCLELAAGKLEPYMQGYIKKRLDNALGDVRRDLSRHLNEHLQDTVKTINQTKSN